MINHLSSSLEIEHITRKTSMETSKTQQTFNAFFNAVGILEMALTKDQARKVFKNGCAKFSFTLDLKKS
jgi:hypothetical protein